MSFHVFLEIIMASKQVVALRRSFETPVSRHFLCQFVTERRFVPVVLKDHVGDPLSSLGLPYTTVWFVIGSLEVV